MKRELAATAVTLAVVGALAIAWHRLGPRTVTTSAGKFPEQLVYVRSADDIVNAGVMFLPPKDIAKPVAIVWIHGWGVNFSYPTYVMIGRALAERGLTTIAGNTRMHDIGTAATERHGKRVRGGGYWGIPSEEERDIAAWMDFAAQQGFTRVVLAGHSAGWAAVRGYQLERQDPRVAGMVLASGEVYAEPQNTDATLLAQASRLVAEGNGEDLLRLPNRSFPSFVSAATFLDIAKAPPEMRDFFGVHTANPGVTRINCPILAFFGTRSDVGTEEDLRLLTSSVQRHSSSISVTTAMIQNADHMYTGEEAQVARTIGEWIDRSVK